MTIKQFIENLTIKNIKAYIQGNFNYWFINLYKKKFYWVEERANSRRELIKIKSPECLNSGQCKCFCNTEEMIYSNKVCKNKCYPEINTEIEWITFKLENNINGTENK